MDCEISDSSRKFKKCNLWLTFLRKGLETLKETLHPRIQLLVLFPPPDEAVIPLRPCSARMLLEGVQKLKGTLSFEFKRKKKS